MLASVQTVPVTPTPVFVTEARVARSDDKSLPIDKTVDVSSDVRKAPEDDFKSETPVAKNPSEKPADLMRPDVRPVIERLDGTKDITETLETEEPDTAETSLRANEAYQTLRDDVPEPVTEEAPESEPESESEPEPAATTSVRV